MGHAVCPLLRDVNGNASDGDERAVLHVYYQQNNIRYVQDDVLTIPEQ